MRIQLLKRNWKYGIYNLIARIIPKMTPITSIQFQFFEQNTLSVCSQRDKFIPHIYKESADNVCIDCTYVLLRVDGLLNAILNYCFLTGDRKLHR